MTQIVPSVTAPVTAPEVSAALTPAVVGGLAQELARNIRDLDEILSLFSVSHADYEKLKNNEFFRAAVDSARVEWHAAGNTIARMQLQCAATAEQGLPHVYARAVSGKEPLNHVVDFFKWLSDTGGMKKDPTKGQAGERFHITINLGADTQISFDGSKAPIGPDQPFEALPMPSFDDKEDRV